MTYNLVVIIDNDDDKELAKKLFDKNNLTYKSLGKKIVIDDNKGHVITILECANINFYVVPPITRIHIRNQKELPEVEKLLEVNRIDYKIKYDDVIIIDVMDENKVYSMLNNANINYDAI